MSDKKLNLQLPGMRNIKTALCVLICLVINYVIREEIVLYSSVAAIVCMQSTIENTLTISLNRLVGTAIGGAAGIVLIPFVENAQLHFIYFILMPIGIIFIIYLCNLIKMPGSAVICAIVYISVVATPLTPSTTTSNPYLLALYRIIDTVIGIVVAMVVNRYIAPPKLYEDREMHLVCNSFNNIRTRIQEHLDGDEALLLFDNMLTKPQKGKFAQRERVHPDFNLSVSVPVPVEYAESSTLKTVYVSSSYLVLPFELPQCDGYVEIPGNFLPCTIVWQSIEEVKALPKPLQ